jgi:hypothetical protein
MAQIRERVNKSQDNRVYYVYNPRVPVTDILREIADEYKGYTIRSVVRTPKTTRGVSTKSEVAPYNFSIRDNSPSKTVLVLEANSRLLSDSAEMVPKGQWIIIGLGTYLHSVDDVTALAKYMSGDKKTSRSNLQEAKYLYDRVLVRQNPTPFTIAHISNKFTGMTDKWLQFATEVAEKESKDNVDNPTRATMVMNAFYKNSMNAMKGNGSLPDTLLDDGGWITFNDIKTVKEWFPKILNIAKVVGRNRHTVVSTHFTAKYGTVLISTVLKALMGDTVEIYDTSEFSSTAGRSQLGTRFSMDVEKSPNKVYITTFKGDNLFININLPVNLVIMEQHSGKSNNKLPSFLSGLNVTDITFLMTAVPEGQGYTIDQYNRDQYNKEFSVSYTYALTISEGPIQENVAAYRVINKSPYLTWGDVKGVFDL